MDDRCREPRPPPSYRGRRLGRASRTGRSPDPAPRRSTRRVDRGRCRTFRTQRLHSPRHRCLARYRVRRWSSPMSAGHRRGRRWTRPTARRAQTRDVHGSTLLRANLCRRRRRSCPGARVARTPRPPRTRLRPQARSPRSGQPQAPRRLDEMTVSARRFSRRPPSFGALSPSALVRSPKVEQLACLTAVACSLGLNRPLT